MHDDERQSRFETRAELLFRPQENPRSSELMRMRESGPVPYFAQRRESEAKQVQTGFFRQARFEHICVSLCMILDPIIFYSDLHHHYLEGSPDFVYILSVFVMAMPVLYMEMFIGQYTQQCCLYFGTMVPLLYGLGIAKLLIHLYILLQISIGFAVSTQYLFLSFNEPWGVCHFDWREGCINLSSLMKCANTRCPLTTVRNLSSYIFYRYNSEVMSPISLTTTIVLCGLGCAIVALGYHRYRRLFQIFFLSTIILTILLTLESQTLGFELVGNFHEAKLSTIDLKRTTVEGILKSLVRPLISMNLAGGGHILLGSHLPLSFKTSLQTVLICFIYVLCIGLGSFYLRLCYYSIEPAAKMSDLGLSQEELIYVIIPAFVNKQPSNSLFAVFFFLACFMSFFSKQIIHIEVICATITGYFTFIEDRRLHIIISTGCMIIVCLIPYFVMSDTHVNAVLAELTEFASLIILEVEVIAVMYVYSYKIFSDDIHFVFGAQPASIWKVLWISLPVLLLIGLIAASIESYSTGAIVLLTIHMSLLIIGGIYKLVKYTQSKNMLGLFLPEASWGMRDPFHRKLREIYNPREETNSKRKVDTCKHNCLLGSEVLSNNIRNEIEIKWTVKAERRQQPEDTRHKAVTETDLPQSISESSSTDELDQFYDETLRKYGLED